MELDLPGEVAQAQEGVSVEEEGVEVGWEVPALELVPVGIVSALVAERDYHIR